MPLTYANLRGRIVENLGSQAEFARRMNLSERTVSLKLSGKIGWRQSEIAKACEVLGIEAREIPFYFFSFNGESQMHKLTAKAKPATRSDPDVRLASAEDGCVHILRGLISYHQRMTMGNYPERDFYLDALRFALACVEEKLAEYGNH